MIRIDKGNKIVIEGTVEDTMIEFGDVVSQYVKTMYEMHPIVGEAAEKSIIASMILGGVEDLPIPDKNNIAAMNDSIIPMVYEIHKSLKVPKDYIQKRWGFKNKK